MAQVDDVMFQSLVGAMRTRVGMRPDHHADAVSIPRRGNEDGLPLLEQPHRVMVVSIPRRGNEDSSPWTCCGVRR